MAGTGVRSIPFTRSLSGRLILLGVLPGMLIVAFVIFWSARERFDRLEESAEGDLLRKALVVASEIGESNANAIKSAQYIAHSQESALFGKRALTVEMLQKLLESDSGITAAYVAYEPNADGNDAAAAKSDPKEWMEAGGRFIPYPFRDWRNRDTIAVKPLIEYETSLYYDGVRKALAESGKPVTVVTEPYIYEGQLIVEQAHPIMMAGRFAGIGGVDRSLESIEREVRRGAKEIGADAYLVSSRGRFIVATNDPEAGAASSGKELRTTEVKASVIASMIEPFVRRADAEGLVENVIDPRNGEELLAAGVRIGSGGWILVCTKPRETVIGPIRAQVAWTATGFALAMLGSGALVAWIALGAGRRIRVAAVAADAIAAGDLTATVAECRRGDEASALLASLRRMQANLGSLLHGVKGAGVTIDSSALQLAATSREQEDVARRFGESSAQIASATREISTTGAELARTMSEVDDAVESTAGLADGARGSLGSVDVTMRELSDATVSIASKLATISERAASINTVITTISKVADQTNLLSVNAAIEAEKAGEQGRGFLVVAREIRRLADQTAGATGDIESIVLEMQAAVGAGVMEMDRFADKVRRGVDEVVASSRQMNQIIAQVGESAVRFRTVSDGMAAQSQGAATISESMGALAAAAKRAVESAEEFRRTAAELQQASQILRRSVGEFRLS